MPDYITKEDFKSYVANNITNTAFEFCDRVSKVSRSRVEDNDFMFDYSAISFPDDMSGEHNFQVEFTSPTHYKVRHSYVAIAGDFFLIGESDIDQPFVHQTVTIPEDTFGGVINEGDQINFSCQGLISNNELDKVIEDAETEIDDYAKSLRILKYDYLDEGQPLFTTAADYWGVYDDSGTIPNFGAVEIATKKFTLAILSDRKLLPSRFVDTSEEGFSHRLKNSARKNIRQFLERWKHYDFETSSVNQKNCELDLSTFVENFKRK